MNIQINFVHNSTSQFYQLSAQPCLNCDKKPLQAYEPVPPAAQSFLSVSLGGGATTLTSDTSLYKNSILHCSFCHAVVQQQRYHAHSNQSNECCELAFIIPAPAI